MILPLSGHIVMNVRLLVWYLKVMTNYKIITKLTVDFRDFKLYKRGTRKEDGELKYIALACNESGIVNLGGETLSRNM